MEWTPEAIQAEVNRRHEHAEQMALVRQLREARRERPWWRRFGADREGGVEDERAAA